MVPYKDNEVTLKEGSRTQIDSGAESDSKEGLAGREITFDVLVKN